MQEQAISIELFKAVASLVFALLGLSLEFHLTETQCEASRDVTAVQHLASAVAEIIRVGVGGTRTDLGTPIEDVLYVDKHRETALEEVAAETHVEEIARLALTHQADGRRVVVG